MIKHVMAVVGIIGIMGAGMLIGATSAAALTITQTADGAALAAALGGGGMTIDSVAINNGDASQFGTYTGFTSPPVTIGNGVVLSTGKVTETTAAFHSSGGSPSTDLGKGGTAEFNAYGPGRIANFTNSNDVAALRVNFTLAAPTQVGFNFVFGSVEFPVFTSNFTDAFLAFLDGTAPTNQIVFDASNNPVQVGNTFASALTTADTNTAFSDPHGLLKLQTFTLGQLSAGSHTLLFQIGDVNDGILDSAVFISQLRAEAGVGGTGLVTPSVPPTNPPTDSTVPPTTIPEPASLGLFSIGLAGLAGARWFKRG